MPKCPLGFMALAEFWFWSIYNDLT
jgi:hypothetical protein